MKKFFAGLFRCRRTAEDNESQPEYPADILPKKEDFLAADDEGLKKFRKATYEMLRKYGRSVRATRQEFQKILRSTKKELQKSLDSQRLEIQGTHKLAVNQLNQTRASIDSLNVQVVALREYVDDKQTELRKYQEGFNWVVTKDLCNRIIMCIDDVARMRSREGITRAHKADLEAVEQILVFALDSCGVEQFEPPVNVPFSKYRQDAEAVQPNETTTVPEEADTIARVVLPGYRIYISEDQSRLARPAKVNVRILKQEEQNNE